MLELSEVLGLNCRWVAGFRQGFRVVAIGFRCGNGGEVRGIFDDRRVLRDRRGAVEGARGRDVESIWSCAAVCVTHSG